MGTTTKTMRKIRNRAHTKQFRQIKTLQSCISELKKENNKITEKLEEINRFVDLGESEVFTHINIMGED